MRKKIEGRDKRIADERVGESEDEIGNDCCGGRSGINSVRWRLSRGNYRHPCQLIVVVRPPHTQIHGLSPPFKSATARNTTLPFPGHFRAANPAASDRNKPYSHRYIIVLVYK